MRIKILLVILLISSAYIAKADDYRDKINEGYDYYKSGVYDKANDKFSEGGIIKPEEALPDYYKGAAQYKLNNFQGAIDEFNSSAAKNDSEIRANSHFNAGNAYMNMRQYDKAVQSYIDALKINPKDEDYKQNLEMALHQMQQQQEQQQQNQDQQGEGQDGDNNQQQQDQQNKQDEKQDDQQQSQDQSDNKEKQQPQQQGQPQKQQMTKEEAEQLLARYEDDEKETQKRLKQVMMQGRSINDW